MITYLATGFALVLVFEGLALALAPSRIEDALAFLASLGPNGGECSGWWFWRLASGYCG